MAFNPKKTCDFIKRGESCESGCIPGFTVCHHWAGGGCWHESSGDARGCNNGWHMTHRQATSQGYLKARDDKGKGKGTGKGDKGKSKGKGEKSSKDKDKDKGSDRRRVRSPSRDQRWSMPRRERRRTGNHSRDSQDADESRSTGDPLTGDAANGVPPEAAPVHPTAPALNRTHLRIHFTRLDFSDVDPESPSNYPSVREVEANYQRMSDALVDERERLNGGEAGENNRTVEHVEAELQMLDESFREIYRYTRGARHSNSSR